jgi:hypothetical protein
MEAKASRILAVAVTVVLGWLAPAAARLQSALPGKPVAVEGTIEGLLSACRDMYCKPGEEDITAALERQYVLVGHEGKVYALPNLKPALLARHIARRVRITGDEISGGRAILVRTAEVLGEGGQWLIFWHSGISGGIRRR